MKRLYLSLLVTGSVVILLLGGCNSVPKNSFEINGTITNNPDNLSKIYLEYTVNDSTVLDSALISPNGTFAFSGTLPSQESLRVLFAKDREDRWMRKMMFFFIEPRSINVSLDADEMMVTYTPANTDLEKEYNEWSAVVMKNARISDKLWSRKWADETPETERAILQQQLDSLDRSNLAFDINFIKQYPKSYVTLYELQMIWHWSDEETKQLVGSIFMQMPSKMQQSDGGIRLKDDIEGRRISAARQPAPDFSITDINGNRVSLLSSCKDRYLLIDFWVSWCEPCRTEVPFLKKIYQAYHSKGLNLLAVSIDEKEDKWKQAVEADKTLWLQANEPRFSKKGRESMARNYYIEGVPYKILIDKDGIIIGRWYGSTRENERDILKVLNEIM